MNKKKLPEINAGSMADIAFLLLIFFLVTTTIKQDSGILRKLPKKENHPTIADIKEKNILEIYINLKNEIMVDDQIVNLNDITKLTTDFLDNGAGKDANGKECTWCEGKKDPTSSDHPSKAVVLIETDRQTSYETFISVLDNVNKAYSFLRDRVSRNEYQISYAKLLKNDEQDREKIKFVKDKYPLLLNDFQVKN